MFAAGGALAGCADSAQERPAAPAPRQALIANSLLVGPSDGWTPLLGVRGMGSFSVRCPQGVPRARFRASKVATVHVTVDGGGKPDSAFLNPDKTLAPPARGRVLVQRWVLGHASEASASVATVSISASRATAVGNPGCQVAGQATVVRRRRTNRAPSGRLPQSRPRWRSPSTARASCRA
jgi:hypothetical protein